MKKIISLILVSIIGISIIPKTLVNEKHEVLESTTSVYTKAEVDSLLSTIRTNITINTNDITNIKSELTTLKNSLSNYALRSDLSTTNSNIDDLNTIVANNTSRIDVIEEGKELIATAITNKGVETFNTDSFETIATNIGNINTSGTLKMLQVGDFTATSYDMSSGDSYARSYFDFSSLANYINDSKYHVYGMPTALVNVKDANASNNRMSLFSITSASSSYQIAIWSYFGNTGYNVYMVRIYVFYVE